MILFSVTHYQKTNTLEAAFVKEIKDEEGFLVSIERVKCESFCEEQKDDFLTACGEEGEKYVTMAGW
jgi:hypothetical protein